MGSLSDVFQYRTQVFFFLASPTGRRTHTRRFTSRRCDVSHQSFVFYQVGDGHSRIYSYVLEHNQPAAETGGDMYEKTTNTFTGGTELQDTIARARLRPTRKGSLKFMNLAVTGGTTYVIVGFKFHGKVTSRMQTRAMMRPQKASDDICTNTTSTLNIVFQTEALASHTARNGETSKCQSFINVSPTPSRAVCRHKTAHADAKRHVYVYMWMWAFSLPALSKVVEKKKTAFGVGRHRVGGGCTC